MVEEHHRRGFLRSLASLPLIGGSVALLGSPTAVAEPTSRSILIQYANWLFMERRLLCVEMAAGDYPIARGMENCAWHRASETGEITPDFHFPHNGRWTDVDKPSTRAAVVMAASGFYWRPT